MGPILFNTDGRYTRQQIAEATGVDRELLAYWSKEGLLLAAESEGLGKGKYRLFGFEAIHIAALLKELGLYGVQTAGLKQVAQLLWSVLAFCSQHPDITEEVLFQAASVRRARARYPVRAPVSPGTEDPDAAFSCFEDWLESKGKINPKAFEIEPWFDEEAELAFALYLDLFTPAIFDNFDTRWLFTHAGNELIAVPEDLELSSIRPEHMRSYIMINLSRIIRPIWMR